MDRPNVVTKPREPWNKGKLVGQKTPFKLKEIWAIRIRLQLANCARDLALFDLAIDSKLRACDLVRLRVRDVSHGDRVAARTIIMQQKTQRSVQFEITEQTREAVARWIDHAKLQSEDFLFPSRLHNSAAVSKTIKLTRGLSNSFSQPVEVTIPYDASTVGADDYPVVFYPG